jgi:hypothetical protein
MAAKRIRTAINWVNPGTNKWQPVCELSYLCQPANLEAYVSELNATGKRPREDWRTVSLPTGESFEIVVSSEIDRSTISLHIRQGERPLLQVLASGMPTVTFTTPGNATVGLHFEEAAI